MISAATLKKYGVHKGKFIKIRINEAHSPSLQELTERAKEFGNVDPKDINVEIDAGPNNFELSLTAYIDKSEEELQKEIDKKKEAIRKREEDVANEELKLLRRLTNKYGVPEEFRA
jgi:hypothetical protein